jgi:hypothetical protein
MNLQKLQDSKLGKINPQLRLKGDFFHFDVAPIVNHKIYYRIRGGGFSPSLGHGENYYLWFIYASLWFSLTPTACIFGL